MRNNRIFSDRGIARMAEVELTSELVVLQLDGLQDKKKSLNNFYDQYDAVFEGREQVVARFRSTLDTIQEALGDDLRASEFHRPPLFYTLFGAIYHRRYGLPKQTAHTPKKPLLDSETVALAEAVDKLSDVLSKAREEETFPSAYQKFVTASLRQTDNIQPRQTRLDALYGTAFG